MWNWEIMFPCFRMELVSMPLEELNGEVCYLVAENDAHAAHCLDTGVCIGWSI